MDIHQRDLGRAVLNQAGILLLGSITMAVFPMTYPFDVHGRDTRF